MNRLNKAPSCCIGSLRLPQALGQCQNFISNKLPAAVTERTSSTGAAAQALLQLPTRDRDPFKCAAICSKMIPVILPELEVLYEGIQDNKGRLLNLMRYQGREETDFLSDNYTRFYILSKTIPDVDDPQRFKGIALIRLSSQPASDQAIPAISEMILALKLRVRRMDRRPSVHAVPFHDVYLVELQQEQGCESDQSIDSWMSDVRTALQRVTEIGGEASFLGLW